MNQDELTGIKPSMKANEFEALYVRAMASWKAAAEASTRQVALTGNRDITAQSEVSWWMGHTQGLGAAYYGTHKERSSLLSWETDRESALFPARRAVGAGYRAGLTLKMASPPPCYCYQVPSEEEPTDFKGSAPTP